MKTIFNTSHKEMFLYHHHQTPEENPRVKYHISVTGVRAICGFAHGNYASNIDTPVMDIAYLSQADPDNWFCKKCQKKALLILQARENLRTYNYHEANREITRRLNILDKKEDTLFDENGFGFSMNDYYETIMKNLNCLKVDIGDLPKNNDSFKSHNSVHPSTRKLNSLSYGSELELNL